jgi:homoserine dehydrogenase
MLRLDLILIGFGNVARRFVRLLDELRPDLAREHEIDTRVVGIATRTRGQIYDGSGLRAVKLATAVERGEAVGRRGTTSGFLNRALARSAAAARQRRLIVVETTTLNVTRGEPAIGYVRAALRGGAHVVTANKGPAAFAYRSLSDTAAEAKRCFLFESAVLDGVPVFNLRRAAMPGVTIGGFYGVINSTTNYILTAMEQGETFGGALAAMQRAGIAEADPSLDIEGWDAAAKTAVLANVLLGAELTPQRVEREGLTAAAAERIRQARAVGRRLKLIASAEKAGGIVRGRVRLVEIPDTDLLAGLEGQQNALILQTDLLGEVAIVQRGWGLTQTAFGLVSDLVSIAREVRQTRATRQARRRARPGRSPSARARR